VKNPSKILYPARRWQKQKQLQMQRTFVPNNDSVRRNQMGRREGNVLKKKEKRGGKVDGTPA